MVLCFQPCNSSLCGFASFQLPSIPSYSQNEKICQPQPLGSSLLFRMPSNTAAWLTASQATPLEIKSAPYTSPGENEILIKNGAVAINPVDWAIQARGSTMFSWVQYPAILGGDVAGEGSYSRIPCFYSRKPQK
jgi:hypothetical protein